MGSLQLESEKKPTIQTAAKASEPSSSVLIRRSVSVPGWRRPPPAAACADGIDNDGDGRINEDSEGYVDPNRNWGFNWAPPYVQSGSGYYPFSGVGISAIRDYIMARPNIIMVFARDQLVKLNIYE